MRQLDVFQRTSTAPTPVSMSISALLVAVS
jgi:hypothetical protein